MFNNPENQKPSSIADPKFLNKNLQSVVLRQNFIVNTTIAVVKIDQYRLKFFLINTLMLGKIFGFPNSSVAVIWKMEREKSMNQLKEKLFSW